MIRKHLITCSLLLIVFIVMKMLISSTTINPLAVIEYNKKIENQPLSTDTYYSRLSFANELLPAGDAKVKKRMKFILKAHKFKQLQTNILHRKAAIYFPVIEPILKYYGIPEDFKYVPLVESGLKSGTSPKGASGYWQFMPQTARDFGLKVDSNVDERQMIRKSTIAACKYIRSLHREFKSWTLVAAAYNIGEGSLKRQMNRQKQANYFKMKLNKETASYVYQLISMKEIIENPKIHGYKGSLRLLARQNFKRDHYLYFHPVAENTSFLSQQFQKN
ncbi:MAG: lytic transglycosylase domain-containing protein [Flavobacterium sp.]|nr:lytic transglycosylase domain-containing protein [Pedobacter sp.]